MTSATPAHARRRWGRLLWLSIPLAVYLVCVGVVNVRTGAWENNDEPDHVKYAEYLLTTGDLPPIKAEFGSETQQAPAYYVGLAWWQRSLGVPAFWPDAPVQVLPKELAGRSTLFRHDYSAAQSMQAGWVHQLRVFSTIWGAITVACAYLLALLVTSRVDISVISALTLALWPKFLVVSAAITNSSMVQAMVGLALVLAVLWGRRHSAVLAAAVGTACGLAVLTQVTAVPATFLIAGLVAGWAVSRREWMSAVVVVVVPILICGWWFVRNLKLYGDPLATAATNASMKALFGTELLQPRPGVTAENMVFGSKVLFGSFWYSGGWNQLTLPIPMSLSLWSAAFSSVVATLLWARARMYDTALVIGTCLASVAAWVAIVSMTTQAQGRFLLLAGVGWALLLVVGWGSRPRLRALAFAWPLAFLAVDAYLAATVLIPDGVF